MSSLASSNAASIMPDVVVSTVSDPTQVSDPAHYQRLRKQARMSQTTLDSGIQLRKRRNPSRFDTDAFAALSQKVKALEERRFHEEIYRILKQIENWEINNPKITPDILRTRAPHSNEVQEIVDLTEDDEDDSSNNREVIDIETYILDVIIKPEPDTIHSGNGTACVDKKRKADSIAADSEAALSLEQQEQSDDDSSVADVTDTVTAENTVERESRVDDDHISIHDSSEESESESEDELSVVSDVDDDSDFDPSEEIEWGNKKKSSKPILPFITVKIDPKDIPSAPGCNETRVREESGWNAEATFTRSGNKRKNDDDIKARILKLLNTGFHEGSNENEAKNAMKLAQRLMQKHNLSQVLLMKERDISLNEGSEALEGGMAKVKIVSHTGKPSPFYRWMQKLALAIGDNFRVKSFYTNTRHLCAMTFYGIYFNVQLAAYAFKVSAERVSVMMQEYAKSVKTRNAYARGIAQGLLTHVTETLKQEEARRKDKLERARLSVQMGEAYEESGDDSDDDDHQESGGFSFPSEGASSLAADVASVAASLGSVGGSTNATAECTINKQDSTTTVSSQGKGDEMSSDATAASKRLERLEQQEEAALALVNQHEKVAEEVLKNKEVKLRKGRKWTPIDTKSGAYADGIEASKELDINQRAIRDEVKVKKEKM